jgi:hypothetical protein
MATTVFFEERLKDKKDNRSLDVEFGRTSYYHGENLIYLKVFDVGLILDEATGRRLSEAMYDVASYLGYARNFAKPIEPPTPRKRKRQ